MSKAYRFGLHHYWSILIAQIVLFFIASLMKDYPIFYTLFAVSLMGMFGSVIVTMRKSRLFVIVAFICGAVALISSTLWMPLHLGDRVMKVALLIGGAGYVGFIAIAIVSMIRDVFKAHETTGDRIVGSICIYLLIGMFFAFTFAMLDIIDPAMFSFGFDEEPSLHSFREYLYFSYTTITTLGYGDMIPLRPIARVLTSIEAMIGPIYLAIMVAGLVGQYVSQSIKQAEKK